MRKIIYTTPILEYPPAGGPFLRVYTSIKALNSISELHVISRVSQSGMGGKSAVKEVRKQCHFLIFAPSVANSVVSNSLNTKDFLQLQLLKMYKLISQTLMYQLVRFFQTELLQHLQAKKDAAFILDYAKKNNISIIWCGYANISYYLIMELYFQSKLRKQNIQIVSDTDSVWSQFILRRLPLITSGWEKKIVHFMGNRKLEQEKNLIKWSTVLTAVSKVDQAQYRDMSTNSSHIKLFSNVIDLEMYQNYSASFVKLQKPFVYLAGYFGPKSPTDLAARWLIAEVMPIVWSSLPDIQLYIVGKGADYTLSDIDNPLINIVGQVPSVLPYLTQAAVNVVPLQFESGTRFKILEAGACKIPVVSTTLGAEGLPVHHAQELLIADSPDDFAVAIQKMISNPSLAKKLALNLHRKVRQHHSVSSLADEGKSILDFLSRITNKKVS